MYTNEPNLVVTAGVHLPEIFIGTSRYHIIFFWLVINSIRVTSTEQ